MNNFKFLLSLLFIIYTLNAFSQSNTDIENRLKKYRNFSVYFGGTQTSKMLVSPKVGLLAPIGLRNYQYFYGYNFKLFTKNKWQINGGLELKPEQIMSAEYVVPTINLPEGFHYLGENTSRDKEYTNTYHRLFSPYMSIRWHKGFKKYIGFLETGVKVMYLLQGSASGGIKYIDDWDDLDSKDSPSANYKLKTNTNEWIWSGQLGVGVLKDYKNCMLELRLRYSYSFEYILAGYYGFTNLKHSPNSYGDLKTQGHFLSLNLGFYWRKSKRKLKKLNF